MDGIEEKLYTTYAPRQSGGTPYCGHGASEDELETELWEYAAGFLDEEEEEVFWERTRHCPYCLERLLIIQQALNTVQQQPTPSADELWEMVHQGAQRAPTLSIRARLFRQAVTILTAVYQNTLEQVQQTLTPHYAAPVPVLAGEELSSRIVRIQRRISGYDIELELEQVQANACDVTVNIAASEQTERQAVVSVALYAEQELFASRVARDGQVTFQALKPGPYTLRIERAELVLVEIALNIESEEFAGQ